MNWTDEGIVLGVRRHGEANAIVEVMTRAHGRHLGLVRGGAGSRMRPVLQPGNTVRVTWRARLDEHLGHYTVEGLRLRAAELMVAAHAAYGVTHLAALCRLLPERDPHEEVHDSARRDPRSHAGPRASRRCWSRASNCRCSPSSASGSISMQCAATGATAELDLRVAEVGPRGVAARRRAVARPHAASAGVSGTEWEGSEPATRRPQRRLRAHRLLLRSAMCSSRAALAMHDARASFINAVLRRIPGRRPDRSARVGDHSSGRGAASRHAARACALCDTRRRASVRICAFVLSLVEARASDSAFPQSHTRRRTWNRTTTTFSSAVNTALRY